MIWLVVGLVIGGVVVFALSLARAAAAADRRTRELDIRLAAAAEKVVGTVRHDG